MQKNLENFYPYRNVVFNFIIAINIRSKIIYSYVSLKLL